MKKHIYVQTHDKIKWEYLLVFCLFLPPIMASAIDIYSRIFYAILAVTSFAGFLYDTNKLIRINREVDKSKIFQVNFENGEARYIIARDELEVEIILHMENIDIQKVLEIKHLYHIIF